MSYTTIYDCQSDEYVDQITIHCLCSEAHGIKIHHWKDNENTGYPEEWEISWYCHDWKHYSLWNRIKQTYRFFIGKTFMDTPVLPEQMNKLGHKLVELTE